MECGYETLGGGIVEEIYDFSDFGIVYGKEHTEFKTIAPKAEWVKLALYDDSHVHWREEIEMFRNEQGIWNCSVLGDLSGKCYTYLVCNEGRTYEVVDPFCKVSTDNSRRAQIFSAEELQVEGFAEHHVPQIPLEDSVVYEVHVRDFSIDETAFLKFPGKFLAFTDENGYCGHYSTGVNHLKEMGITHIHFMPIFDFKTVEEIGAREYNWGYDPELFNVPEGSYATNAEDGRVRIRELKKMIQFLHQEGFQIVMDVVYNHTYKNQNSSFNRLLPGIFYRLKEDGSFHDGSGVGNEFKTEEPFVRAYIIWSLKQWMKDYKIDGFRFDLMGLMDVETVKKIAEELRRENPNILLYGEPWTAMESGVPKEIQFQKGLQKGLQIGVFNDIFRDAIKGSPNCDTKGFIFGDCDINDLQAGILGEIEYSEKIKGFAEEAIEAINYISCHDDYILMDCIQKKNNESEESVLLRNKLAFSILLTSFGIPFIQAGTEFGRSKRGYKNTYCAGDSVNKIQWSDKERYEELFLHVKQLIEFRKEYGVFKLRKGEEIRKAVSFLEAEKDFIAYEIHVVGKPKIVIAHNSSQEKRSLRLSEIGDWWILSDGVGMDLTGRQITVTEETKNMLVPPLGSLILTK